MNKINSTKDHRSGRSPWAGLGAKRMRVVKTGGPVKGRLSVPGSKSVTNRVLLMAAVAEGESVLSGILRSDDSYWCLEALKELGIAWSLSGTQVTLTGCGGHWPNRHQRLFLGSAGTLARFLPGLLAASEGEWHLDASDQLSGRPMAGITRALRVLGARIDNDTLPYRLTGNGLGQGPGDTLVVPGAGSSQFLSGLLMAAPLAHTPITITVPDHIVQEDYVRITLDCMAQFGVTVAHDTEFRQFSVQPQTYRACRLPVEADASTATYFMALAAATEGDITIDNIGSATRQPDFAFAHLLEQMGARVRTTPSTVTVSGPAQLKGGFDVDMRPMSDAALTLAAIAPFADGPIRIRNVAHIRKHESDRIAEMCRALRQAGIVVAEHDDGMTIHPSKPQLADHATADDHRLAMALAVMGAAGEGAVLDDPGCVSKTCPIFFELLASLGISCQTED